MRTEQELIELTTNLLEKGDYQAIIDLLTDVDLELLKSAKLYFYRGNALNFLSKYSSAIEDLSKAILLENNLFAAYNNRGIAFSAIGDNNSAIRDYTIAISLKRDYIDAYINRGLVWIKKGEIDKAHEDYNEAIKVDKNNAVGYYNRGNSWFDRRDYEEAIVDYTSAINLNKNYSDAYQNRGNSYTELRDYKSAIKDYSIAIDINKFNCESFNCRGIVQAYLEENDKAIEDFTAAINIDRNYATAYYNRGILYKNLFEYGRAYDSFDAAFDIACENIESPLNTKMQLIFFHITRPYSSMVKKEEMKKIFISYTKNIEPIIDKISEIAIDKKNVWDDKSISQPLVAHYTSLKTADLLLMNYGDSKLRYNNAVFMNDPQEGKIFIECISKLEELDTGTNIIKSTFDSVMANEKTNFYLGSFLPVTNNHEDELIMWRTYGKDEHNKEATGCCLLIDTDFFDMTDLGYIADYTKTVNKMPQPLYRVLYYDQRNNEFLENREKNELLKQLKKLKDGLVDLLKMKKKGSTEEDKNYDNAIDKVLYHSLSELRYFFKSADFAYENELRVIQYATNKDVMKIDDQSNTLPRKVFIESSQPILPHLKEIILGPMVPHPERWMYLQKIMTDKGHDFKLRHSNCRFQ